MKMIKVHIVLAILLLGNAVAMQGMMQQGKKVLKKPVYKPIKQKVYKPSPQPIPVPKPTTQTWGNWVKSLFYAEPIKPVQMNMEPEESYAAEEVAPSPFEGGQKRRYSTYRSSTQTQIPESFEPSLKSRIPWTNEYKIEEMFRQMNKDLSERREDGTYKSSGDLPFGPYANKFQELVQASGYNPLNRDIPGEPSFFAKLLIAFFKKSLDNQYHSQRDYPAPGYGEDVIQQFYQMGARYRRGKDWNEAIDGIRNLLRRIVAFTRIDKIEEITAGIKLGEIIKFASINLEWYKFLNSIGLQDAAFHSPTINWNKIEELCELELDPTKLKETIEDLQKKPKELLNPKDGMVSIVMITKYGRSDRPISGEYVINLLRGWHS
ncbi:MAG TPA: hypothetical protein VHX42_03595 [Candidatus Babeliales bacterium]|nr:hypothetical protein [Candidatus Babeliales bacterium]